MHRDPSLVIVGFFFILFLMFVSFYIGYETGFDEAFAAMIKSKCSYSQLVD